MNCPYQFMKRAFFLHFFLTVGGRECLNADFGSRGERSFKTVRFNNRLL
jgi:hypothetical protein